MRSDLRQLIAICAELNRLERDEIALIDKYAKDLNRIKSRRNTFRMKQTDMLIRMAKEK